MSESQRFISVRGAARLVYGVAEPSHAQIEHLEMLLQAGALKGKLVGPPGKAHWATTPAAVADLLARRTIAVGTKAEQSDCYRPEKQQPLVDVYQDILRDYFMAMLFRKKRKNATKWFNRSVLAGQLVAILLIAGLCFGAIRPLLAGDDPRHVAIRHWIEENAGQHQITYWHPVQPNPKGTGEVVGVRYLYFRGGRKGVETERFFTLENGQVTGVSMDRPGT